jgi:hypothetical protein
MSKVEQQEVKLEVDLPGVGFPKSMYFNRFHVEREDAFCLVQFGLVLGSDLLDSYSCVFSKDMLRQNQESLLTYLNRIGRAEGSPPPWKGTSVENKAEMADVITMAFRGETAETCLYFFSLSAATRLRRTSTGDKMHGQALVLLRSTADMQKQFIVGLYEQE